MKISQGFVIGGDRDWVVGAFEVMAPFGTGDLDRQELFVANVVARLGRIEGSGVEAAGAEDAFRVGLGQDGADGEVTGIGFEDKWRRGISVNEDRRGGEGSLQGEECRLLLVSPCEGNFFSCK